MLHSHFNNTNPYTKCFPQNPLFFIARQITAHTTGTVFVSLLFSDETILKLLFKFSLKIQKQCCGLTVAHYFVFVYRLLKPALAIVPAFLNFSIINKINADQQKRSQTAHSAFIKIYKGTQTFFLERW